MGFFGKLFGKTEKRSDAEPFKKVEDMTEEELINEAVRFIQVNAEGEDGDPEYQFKYGVIFATGKGLDGHGSFPKDFDKAVYWLKKSAAQGNVNAVCMLGRVYMDHGDAATAVTYYREAAEKGNEAACENLAMAYGMGTGVAEDKVEAHKWFLKAAELGSAFAQYIVGMNLFDGTGVAENPAEAMQWFEKAADQGEPNAQFMMGQFFELGHHDVDTALQWYRKAAEQGHEEAGRKFRNCNRASDRRHHGQSIVDAVKKITDRGGIE